MARHHQTFEHTADIGVSAGADSLGELFEALAEATAGVVCAAESVRATASRSLSLGEEEPDLEGLLVDFLGEVLATIQQGRFMVRTVQIQQIAPTALSAELLGEPYDPARHELLTEVKAVTWHQLLLTETEAGWRGRVILDL